MKLLYFAWLKTKIGLSEEDVDPPADVRDVDALLAWLRGRGPAYANALAHDAVIKVAVNQRFAERDTRIDPDDEVALFPPVTGG